MRASPRRQYEDLEDRWVPSLEAPAKDRLLEGAGAIDLITLLPGGTSGIGRALAKRLRDRGNPVIVAARRRELLDDVTVGRAGMTGTADSSEEIDAMTPPSPPSNLSHAWAMPTGSTGLQRR